MIKNNHRYFSLLVLLLIGLALSTQSAAGQSSPNAAPQVTTHSTNTNQVGRYQKFEVTFQISRTYPADSILPYYFYDPADPRGVDGITIDGHFVGSSGRELVVPAFYYQDYTRSGTNTVVMTPSNNFSWKLRFAPEETGTYNYFITVTDKSGSSRYPASGALQFQSAESTSKGFVRVSPRDPRFLEFSNGESYIPNSAGRVWWMPGSPLRSLDYDNVFNEFGRNGINLTRVWDQNDGYALTVEGHFDAYKYPDDFNPEDRGVNLSTLPKGTQMNQRGNYEEDKIIEAAERNGIYILLCSHGDAYWIWDASIYNNPPSGWTDAARVRQWQRNFRYRVARWGYSTSVLAWEHWNELGHVPVNSDIYRFYQTYGQYQQQTDAYRHLRTTSQGSQAWSPAFWASSAFDIATYHDYMMISRYNAELTYDAAHFVYRFAQCLRTPDNRSCGLGVGDGSTWQGGPRPILWAELDTGTSNWNEANPQPKATHDMRWAGLFSPIGMSPIDWYYSEQSATFTTTKYREAKIAGDFFKGVDYAGKNFVYLSTTDVRMTSEVINTSNAALRVLAMRASNGSEAYAWVQNKGNARWDQAAAPAPLSATFTVPSMAAGNYTVEIWDTYTGQITTGSNVAVSNGQVTVSVSNLTKDVAIKIRSTNQPAATPTVAPTLALPTTTPLPPTPPGAGSPIAGQIMVNPSDTRWLVYNQDTNGDGKKDPFFWAGPGGPEDFLFRNDQSSIASAIANSGSNSIYMHLVRSHGGDGSSNQNPFVGGNPQAGIDQTVLSRWDRYLTDLENKGIVALLFFYDDAANPFPTGNTVSQAERNYIQAVVNRFEHHKNIIWGVTEEYEKAYTPTRISRIAAEIRAADDFDHPIAVHQLGTNTTFDFGDDPNLDMFALQSDALSYSELHNDVLLAYSDARGRFVITMSENYNEGQADHARSVKNGDRADIRKRNWASAMAGGYVMVLGTWETIGGVPSSDMLRDWGNQRRFFETANFQEMSPRDDLKAGNTEYVLAKVGESYIAYGTNATSGLGLAGLPSGTYSLTWFDTATGSQTAQTVTAVGTTIFPKPAGLGTELAVYVRKTGASNVTPQPSATPTRAIPTNTPMPTATPLPPTLTATFTPMPPTLTYTPIPPSATATSLPPTATSVTSVPTAGLPSATPVTPTGPSLRLDVNPPVAAPGAAVDVALSLLGVANLYGLEVACGVNPAVLAGTAHLGADAFNDSNALFVDQGFRPDGSWIVAATRLRPHAPISGDSAAFTLRYTVLAAGSSPITCTARAVDANGRDLPLTVFNTSFNPPGAPIPTLPPTAQPSLTPTMTTVTPSPTSSAASTISGVITFPGRTDHTGIIVALATNGTPLTQLTTTSSGAYRFTDVPPGDYSLTIIASQALPMQQPVTLAADGAGVDLDTHTLPMGDTDGSGTIDLADAALVSANYGLDASRLPAADLNADAVINLRDLVLVGSSFGLSAPLPLK